MNYLFNIYVFDIFPFRYFSLSTFFLSTFFFSTFFPSFFSTFFLFDIFPFDISTATLFTYWNAYVYNIDEQLFFSLLSTFLASLWDRTSVYLLVSQYRPPWPRFLVSLAKEVNGKKKRYRRTHFFLILMIISLRKINIKPRGQVLNKQREKNK